MKSKVLSLCVALICAGIFFTKCKKVNENPESYINVKVEFGEKYDFDNVKAVMYSYDDDLIIGESGYSKGKFSIKLPKTVESIYLEEFDFNYEADWITINPENALMNFIFLEAYKSDEWEDDFIYATLSFNQTQTKVTLTFALGMYLYVDKNVTIKGSETEKEIIEGIEINVNMKADVYLKKGWNIIYEEYSIIMQMNGGSIKSSITTKKPKDMKWYVEDDLEELFDNLIPYSTEQQPSQLKTMVKSSDIKALISKYRVLKNFN